MLSHLRRDISVVAIRLSMTIENNVWEYVCCTNYGMSLKRYMKYFHSEFIIFILIFRTSDKNKKGS